MLGRTMRAGVLGLLALLVAGALAATPAFAEVGEGPYCHHREKGSIKEDGRITGASPEEVFGEGGKQKLSGKIMSLAEEILAESVQVKGIIYNNADQCQAKLELKYHGLTIPGVAHCTPVVNGNNTVKVSAHRGWKYGGIKKELEEAPRNQQKLDWIVTPGTTEIEQGSTAEKLPTGLFATITFETTKGSKEPCSLLAVSLPVEGTVGIESHPSGLEEWASKEEQIIETIAKQQYWNGKAQIPFLTGLTLNGSAATYIGSFKIETTGKQSGKTPAQEVAYFES